MGFVIPAKTTTKNSVTKGEKITEDGGVNSISGRESSGEMST